MRHVSTSGDVLEPRARSARYCSRLRERSEPPSLLPQRPFRLRLLLLPKARLEGSDISRA